MRNQKGFTLVELIVSVAILSVLLVAIMGFVVSGARAYGSVNATVTLQTLSQQAMGQVESYLIDCNGGLAFSGDTLYVVDRNDDGTTCTAYVFRLDGTELYFGKNDDAGKDSALSSGDLMTRDLAAFTAAPSRSSGKASAVDVEMEFEYRGKTYSATEHIALRNNPVVADSYAELMDALAK